VRWGSQKEQNVDWIWSIWVSTRNGKELRRLEESNRSTHRKQAFQKPTIQQKVSMLFYFSLMSY
jgi:hypothetical protein